MEKKTTAWTLKSNNVDKHKTHQWLKSAEVKTKTKPYVMAEQDQSLKKLSSKYNIKNWANYVDYLNNILRNK